MSALTEKELIDICQQLGNIVNSNSQYTIGLAIRINSTGKPVEELTLNELIELDNQHRACFNEVAL